MTFRDKLNRIVKLNDSLLCIGLDTDFPKIPDHLKNTKHPQFEFNKAIIDATSNIVCCYKPNIAFYEACGLKGLLELKFTCDYLNKKYPQIPIILDTKIGDIANTNNGYVKFIFDILEADAVTVHPYLGKESLTPFLERIDREIFVLCRTSNEGAGEFQDLLLSKSQPADSAFVATSAKEAALAKEGTPLYQIIAQHVVKDWNYNGNCGLVIGATYPTELEIVRRLVGNMPILIPGIGAQGADVEKTTKAGIDKHGINAIINSSRGIIFASNGLDFAVKAQHEAIKLKREINKYRFI